MCTTVDQEEDQRELQTLVEEAVPVHPHTEKEATTTSTNGSGINGHVTIGTNNHHHHQNTTKEETVILVADTKIIHYSSNNSKDRIKYASNEYLESEV